MPQAGLEPAILQRWLLHTINGNFIKSQPQAEEKVEVFLIKKKSSVQSLNILTDILSMVSRKKLYN